MNKEIRDYQESMFMGLDLRQCMCSVLAILTAIGIYFGMRDITGQEVTGWLCVIGAAPFAACGFFKYHGMTAEQFLWAVIKSELLYPKKLVFQSEDLYLKSGTADGQGTVQSSKIRSTGDSYPADLAGWNLSTGNEVFENISFYRYQLLHCE